MGLKNISGGSNFSLAKFRQNLGTATKFGNLKNFREPMTKIIEKNSAAIKGGRFKAAEAMRHLQSEAGRSSVKLNYEAKRDIGRIFESLEKVPAPEPEKISRREVLDRALKQNNGDTKPIAHDRMEKTPLKVHTNRADSEFNLDKVKNNRVSAVEERLKTGTGVSGPTGPSNQSGTKPSGATAAPRAPGIAPINHESINLN